MSRPVGDAFDDEVERFFSALPAVLEDAGTSHVARARAWRAALFDAGLAGFGIVSALPVKGR